MLMKDEESTRGEILGKKNAGGHDADKVQSRVVS